MKQQEETRFLGSAQVTLVDKIFDTLFGNEGRVETENDWKAVVLLFELYKLDRPEEYRDFLENMKQNREATRDNHAIIRDGNGDMVQHALEIPARFYQYLNIVFPNIEFDQKFFKRLSRELPILKMTENL